MFEEDDAESASAEHVTGEGEATEDSSAGSENTDSSESGETQSRSIPIGRFQQVVGQRNALREENARLKAAAEAGSGSKSDATATAGPPEGLDARGKLQWYLRQTVNESAPDVVQRVIQQELGVDLAGLKKLLGGIRGEVEQTQIQRFEKACGTAGLDPKSKDVRTAAASMIKATGCSIDQAVGTIAKISKRSAAVDDFGDGMLIPGLTGVTAVDDASPETWDEGVALAQRGRAVRPRSATEILRLADAASKRSNGA